MGNAGRTITSFLDGALAGVELKQRWNDRKRQQARDDEDQRWRAEDRALSLEDRKIAAEDRARRRAAEDEDAAWTREERQSTRRSRGILEAERQRQAAIRDADSAALAGAFEQTEKKYENEKSAAAKADVPMSALETQKVVPIPGGALEKALESKPEDRPKQEKAQLPEEPRAKDDAVAPAEAAPPDPSAPMVQAPVAGTAARQAGILQSMNPFSSANAAEVPQRGFPVNPWENGDPVPEATDQAPVQSQPDPRGQRGPMAKSPAAPEPMVYAAPPINMRGGQGETGPSVMAGNPEQPRSGVPANWIERAMSAKAPDAPASITPAAPRRARGVIPPKAQTPAPASTQAPPQDRPHAPQIGANPPAANWPVAQDQAPDAPAEVPGRGRISRFLFGGDEPAAPAYVSGEGPGQPGIPGAASASAPPTIPATQRGAAPRPAIVPSDVPPGSPPPTTPSIEVAVQTGPKVDTNRMRRSQGVQPKAEKQRAQATRVRDFMEIYAKEAVPQIQEHYLKTGRPEEASKWGAWAKAETTRAGMEAWARTVHAAQMNDDEGFFEAAIDTYNATDYYEDGMEIVRSQSTLTRDANNDVDATLAFRNQRTGEITTQHFNGMKDIYQMGVFMLSPEQVFEKGMAEIAAGQDFASKQAEEELKHSRNIELEGVKAGSKGKSPEDEITSTWKAMAEEDQYGNGFNALPEPEKQAAVLARIQSVKRMASGGNLGAAPTNRQFQVAPVNF